MNKCAGVKWAICFPSMATAPNALLSRQFVRLHILTNNVAYYILMKYSAVLSFALIKQNRFCSKYGNQCITMKQRA
jgi:hypothetical protein